MIPVSMAAEPTDFDAKVRQKGLRALAEMVGETVLPKRRGKLRAKIAESREDIPANQFPPFWTKALPDMLTSYKRLCAYLALHLEPATGNPTVDHRRPKSSAWDQAYEWGNYRLASALINSMKSDKNMEIDPFTVAPETFALEFTAFQVKPGSAAVGALEKRAIATIETLGLNKKPCRDARQAYFDNYMAGEINLAYLDRRAPFIVQELRRQKLLRNGDA
jgi:hypothetical protein